MFNKQQMLQRPDQSSYSVLPTFPRHTPFQFVRSYRKRSAQLLRFGSVNLYSGAETPNIRKEKETKKRKACFSVSVFLSCNIRIIFSGSTEAEMEMACEKTSFSVKFHNRLTQEH